jgi:Cysteine rich repeat
MADAKSLCSGIAGTGIEPLRGCFRDRVKEVSGACLLSLAKLLEVDSACRAHINQQCANVQIGEGRLEACLRTAVGTLSDSCKDAIVRAVPGAR